MIAVTAALYGCAPSQLATPSSPPTATGYGAWVTSESADEVSLVSFDGRDLEVLRTRRIGTRPVEIDGPHGVAASPDGRFIYVTLGHGVPNGYLWKMEAATDRIVARSELGLFPATVAVTPDGEYGFVSNFNLHGDHVPSSVSKVHLPTMAEAARIETCVMPHGSRINRQGTRHYSTCMMDEELVEIDVAAGAVARRFSLRRGSEGPLAGGGHAHDPAGAAAPGAAAASSSMAMPGCSPTWAEPSADGSRVFVACNRAREVVEIDVASWSVVRRFVTGDAPYNLATSPDGRFLLVSLRSRTEPALEIFELAGGSRVAHLPTSTTLAHGIAVTPDSRYAFVSVEGVGAEPGKVDLFDLTLSRMVGSVEVGQQATGIAIAP